MQETGTERRRSTWRPIALATVAGAVLVAMGVGVWATLSATASNAASPEQVTTGTLSLTMAAAPTTAGGSTASAGFGQAISNLAPGDSVNRYIDLTNGGSLDAQSLTLAVAANGSSQLITDGTTSRALRVSVTKCTTAWTTATAACGGTSSTLLAPTALSGLTSATSLYASAITSGTVTHLQVTVTLPDQNETTVNGVAPTGTIQGQTANLVYTFGETQRNATTSNS